MDFGKLLKPEAVKVLTSASSKKRLMQDIGELAQQAYGLPAGQVVDALMTRETLGPTGVGHGVALPHARIMMHQPLGGVRGQASDIAIQAEQMAYTKKMLQERIAQHTGQPVETIASDSDRDRWFTADEAQEYGIIDQVIVRRGEMH